MSAKVIPQRELRNNIGAVLREAEAGTRFTVTVRGRPVATVGPVGDGHTPRTDVDGRSVRALLARTPVDDAFATDIAALRASEAPVDDPWPTD